MKQEGNAAKVSEADRDQLGSLVMWLRAEKRGDILVECAGPWRAALERILAHIDAEGVTRVHR